MKYKALALDLDGTLINSEKKLSTKNKKAVMAAAERGVHIILASGRPLFGIEPVAEALELPCRRLYSGIQWRQYYQL